MNRKITRIAGLAFAMLALAAPSLPWAGARATTGELGDPALTAVSPAPAVLAFDVCIQDDADSHKVLVFSSQTGAYRFCCDSASFTGVGLVKIKGKVISLAHYPTDRKLFATVDMATHRATASLQFPHATVPCTIIDRNTLDDTCSSCSVVGT